MVGAAGMLGDDGVGSGHDALSIAQDLLPYCHTPQQQSTIHSLLSSPEPNAYCRSNIPREDLVSILPKVKEETPMGSHERFFDGKDFDSISFIFITRNITT